jgi:hypothetical protein
MTRDQAIEAWARAKHDPLERYWPEELARARMEIAALESVGLLKFNEPVDKSDQTAVLPK